MGKFFTKGTACIYFEQFKFICPFYTPVNLFLPCLIIRNEYCKKVNSLGTQKANKLPSLWVLSTTIELLPFE